jgi:hypothetical protein
MRRLGPAVALLLVLLAPGVAHGQATRTWVSGVGDDVNPCSRTAPCKTFAGAISKTAVAGEIDALDEGGFGAVTITKSITIDGGGNNASILASGTNGVNINIPDANPGDPSRRVVLRNLSINGTGLSAGLLGVNILSAKDVRIESSRIFNFSQNGVDFTPTSTADANLTLDGVTLADNTLTGLKAAAAATTQTLGVMVRNSTIEGTSGVPASPDTSGIGVSADTGAHVWLTGTTVFDNLTGIKSFGNLAGGPAGIIDSFCDNQLAGNGTDGTFSNTFCQNPPPPTVVTNTNTVTTPAPPPVTVTVTKTVTVPAATVRCVVPKLVGLTLATARTRLNSAHCALGTVTRKRAGKASQVGRVTAQGTAAKKVLKAKAKIAVTVGRR